MTTESPDASPARVDIAETEEVRRLRESVDRLTADRGAIKDSTDNLTAALGEVRTEMSEARRRADLAQETAEARATPEDVEASVTVATLTTARAFRHRFVALVLALIVVVGVGLYDRDQQHRTTARFNRVHTGLIEGCTKTQASNTALRVKNTQLRDDTLELARQVQGASEGKSDRLAPIRDYLNAEAAAYADYLKAIPKPVDCQARYGGR